MIVLRGMSIKDIFRLIRVKWKILLVSMIMVTSFFYLSNSRDLVVEGNITFTTDYNTDYGAYPSGLMTGQEFSDLILNDEFIQLFISQNSLVESISDIRSMMTTQFASPQTFTLKLKTQNYTITKLYKQFLTDNASTYISYSIQKRAIDSFVNSYNNGYVYNLNQFNSNKALIELYKTQLAGLEPYLIQTNTLVVVNPSYAYVEQKILDLEFNNIQIEPTMNWYLAVTQDMQTQQALYVTYAGYLSSDRRFDATIHIDYLLTDGVDLFEYRFEPVTLLILGALMGLFVGLGVIYLLQTHQISKDQLGVIRNSIVSMFKDTKTLGTSYKALWKDSKQCFNAIAKLIIARV